MKSSIPYPKIVNTDNHTLNYVPNQAPRTCILYYGFMHLIHTAENLKCYKKSGKARSSV